MTPSGLHVLGTLFPRERNLRGCITGTRQSDTLTIHIVRDTDLGVRSLCGSDAGMGVYPSELDVYQRESICATCRGLHLAQSGERRHKSQAEHRREARDEHPSADAS